MLYTGKPLKRQVGRRSLRSGLRGQLSVEADSMLAELRPDQLFTVLMSGSIHYGLRFKLVDSAVHGAERRDVVLKATIPNATLVRIDHVGNCDEAKPSDFDGGLQYLPPSVFADVHALYGEYHR
jgi:hypothetical protein